MPPWCLDLKHVWNSLIIIYVKYDYFQCFLSILFCGNIHDTPFPYPSVSNIHSWFHLLNNSQVYLHLFISTVMIQVQASIIFLHDYHQNLLDYCSASHIFSSNQYEFLRDESDHISLPAYNWFVLRITFLGPQANLVLPNSPV